MRACVWVGVWVWVWVYACMGGWVGVFVRGEVVFPLMAVDPLDRNLTGAMERPLCVCVCVWAGGKVGERSGWMCVWMCVLVCVGVRAHVCNVRKCAGGGGGGGVWG